MMRWCSDRLSSRTGRIDLDGVLKPQLAKALPVISADKKSYTFDLRDDVTFHNGKKMTAEDVKYSFDICSTTTRPLAARSSPDRQGHPLGPL